MDEVPLPVLPDTTVVADAITHIMELMILLEVRPLHQLLDSKGLQVVSSLTCKKCNIACRFAVLALEWLAAASL